MVDGQPIAGLPLQLWQKTGSTWIKAQTATTASNGSVTFAVKTTTSTAYQIRYPGGSLATELLSGTASNLASPTFVGTVAAAFTKPTVARRSQDVLKVSTTPAAGNASMTVETFVSGRWKTVKKTSLNGTGRARTTITAGTAHYQSYRACIPARAGYAATCSGTVHLTTTSH